MLERRAILKNIIIVRIQEVRELKRKPKLKDLLEMFRGKDKEWAA